MGAAGKNSHDVVLPDPRPGVQHHVAVLVWLAARTHGAEPHESAVGEQELAAAVAITHKVSGLYLGHPLSTVTGAQAVVEELDEGVILDQGWDGEIVRHVVWVELVEAEEGVGVCCLADARLGASEALGEPQLGQHFAGHAMGKVGAVFGRGDA